MHEEDKDFPRPQRLVTLADFFPTRFLCDHQDKNPGVVACHAINATEEESIPLRSLEEERVSKDLSRFNVDDLLSLSQETKTILINALLNSAASSSSAPTVTYESTSIACLYTSQMRNNYWDLNFIIDPCMFLDMFENRESTEFSSIMDQLST
ncbi:ty3-gypsy retrotransposon protein [Cucumis melo var. makuwa]|uniref:Ty3-gypsy retrotransposon protein n=1 Tax=Cucumis melo var. makuwa TaxID=1194695 RepID=A0A5A7V608_CUCMM|nr:ty3-gypsy retrotransposon protein [Cucumis melo var. makuwa]